MRSNDQIIDVLTELKNQQGLSLSELARRVGMAKSALSRYFNKTREFPLNKVDLFAQALDTTAPYILGLDVETRKQDILKENVDIVPLYNQLHPQRQKKVYNYASNQLEEQNSNVVEMPSHEIEILGAVSAGTGEELISDKDTIDYMGAIPPNYDYALVVDGDSMTPLFSDHQIIFVRQAYEARNGQIIIAMYQGQAYVKKLEKHEYSCYLVSLNSKYDPIDVTDDSTFEIKGVVVL